jgi:hypothetical protein
LAAVGLPSALAMFVVELVDVKHRSTAAKPVGYLANAFLIFAAASMPSSYPLISAMPPCLLIKHNRIQSTPFTHNGQVV